MRDFEQLPAAILDRVAFEPTSGCWLWIGKRTKNGYGQIQRTTERKKKYLYVHRVVYETLVGPIPSGLENDHLCRTRPCCNPDHLEPVTGLENWRRGESLSAQNLRKTHCLRGHVFEGENLYLRGDTWGRECRACRKIAKREWEAQRRAKIRGVV